MITTIILGFIYFIVVGLINLLPVVSANSEFSTSLITASSFLAASNNYLPVLTILTVLTLGLTIEGGILTYKGIMWVLKRLPTQS